MFTGGLRKPAASFFFQMRGHARGVHRRISVSNRKAATDALNELIKDARAGWAFPLIHWRPSSASSRSGLFAVFDLDDLHSFIFVGASGALKMG